MRLEGPPISVGPSWLVAVIGLGLALSVGAQTTTTDEKQEPAQQEGKANVEQKTKPGQQRLAPRRAPMQNEQINPQERTRSGDREGARPSERDAQISEHVFRMKGCWSAKCSRMALGKH
jgi:hypothetical protein